MEKGPQNNIQIYEYEYINTWEIGGGGIELMKM